MKKSENLRGLGIKGRIAKKVQNSEGWGTKGRVEGRLQKKSAKLRGLGH